MGLSQEKVADCRKETAHENTPSFLRWVADRWF
jgi:hypothetical protein